MLYYSCVLPGFLVENMIITRFFRGEVQNLHFFPRYFKQENPIFIGYLTVGTGSILKNNRSEFVSDIIRMELKTQIYHLEYRDLLINLLGFL